MLFEYSARNELVRLSDTFIGEDELFEYDLRGNLTRRYYESGSPATNYYWSADDKLTTAVRSGTTVQYKYDLLGRRVAKRVNSGPWRWFFYDGLKVIAEGTGTNDRP